jgi:uncharacterized protein YcbK (DUF882 family)
MPDEDTWVFENFKPEEFTCKCDGLCDHEDIISRELVGGLQLLRTTIGRGVYVTNGVRCPEHNKNVGGVADSKHLYGLAADIQVRGMTTEELAHEIEQIEAFVLGGVGLYDNFVHVDVRGRRARWDNRS